MAKKQIVGSMSEWSGLLKDLFRQIDDGSIGLPQLQAFLERRNPFGFSALGIDWRKLYAALGMEAEYLEAVKELGLPHNEGLWTFPVVKGVTCNKMVAAMRKLGVNVYTYVDDLDKGVPTNDRSPDNGSYLVSFRRNVEADPENKSKSANQLAADGHKGITLLERLLLELGYFLATGKHLDVSNWTLCAGSRDGLGRVPNVCFGGGKVGVRWCSPDYSNDPLRSRSVVS